jgi:hypothetical protein
MRKGTQLNAGLIGAWLLFAGGAAQALTIATTAGTTTADTTTAGSVVYEHVGTLTETNFFFQDTFSIDIAGTYTVFLSNLAAGAIQPFQELGVLLTTPTQVLANLSEPGMTTFDFAGAAPELITAIVFGVVNGPPFPGNPPGGVPPGGVPPPFQGLPGFGVFGLEVSVTPVPVPAALPLMLSALIGLTAIARRRRDEHDSGATSS